MDTFETVLQHTKRQVELFEMHCLSIFITTLCANFLRHSEFYLPKNALRKQKAIERPKRHIEPRNCSESFRYWHEHTLSKTNNSRATFESICKQAQQDFLKALTCSQLSGFTCELQQRKRSRNNVTARKTSKEKIVQSASSQRTVKSDVDRTEVARPVQSSACLNNCNREMTQKKV